MKTRILRFFNSVGQGGFYTETFWGDDGSRFVVVYDCGTETADKDLDISLDHLIDMFAKKYSQIDVLFISHFHADHISGMNKLLSQTKVIKTVIPMLDIPTITVTRVQNFLRFNSRLAQEADSIIQDLYLGGEKTNRFGEVVMVSPESPDEPHKENEGDAPLLSNGNIIYSGSRINVKEIWEYIPFNSIERNDSRAQAVLNGLYALTDGKLTISDLLKYKLEEVKDVYRQAMNNANDNLYTLVVISKPVDGIIAMPHPKLAPCIYFGDFDYRQKNKPWERLNEAINYAAIGTVQVPHHGAKGNWRTEMGDGNHRHYIVSTGSTNGHHHPNYWVLREIAEKKHELFVVSEKLKTRKKYVYYV